MRETIRDRDGQGLRQLLRWRLLKCRHPLLSLHILQRRLEMLVVRLLLLLLWRLEWFRVRLRLRVCAGLWKVRHCSWLPGWRWHVARKVLVSQEVPLLLRGKLVLL